METAIADRPLLVCTTEHMDKLGLSNEAQTKVFAIYDLARACRYYNKKPISTKEFDTYYDMQVDELIMWVNEVKDVYMKEQRHKIRDW